MLKEMQFEKPLSADSGLVNSLQDFHWIARNIPCQYACPAQTDIPGYLDAIARGDYDEAYRINLLGNVFPAVLGRICSRPCEPPCRHGYPGLGQSVAICYSKRAACDFRNKPAKPLLTPVFPSSGKKVAVIGGGPAGLTVARQLTLYGHKTTIFEKDRHLGGILFQAIPHFRLPRDIVENEIQQIIDLGVEVVLGYRAGTGESLDSILHQFDALVLAAGTQKVDIPDIAGVQLNGVYSGLNFLRSVSEQKISRVEGQVAVIGGGFTAVDCARTALRLGAQKVRLLYRRTRNEMRITPGEFEEMAEEGVEAHFQVSPKEIIGRAGCVNGIRLIRTETTNTPEQGKKILRELENSLFSIDADTVLLAIGQRREMKWLPAEMRQAVMDDMTQNRHQAEYRTAMKNIFIAGDFATGAQTVIQAVGHAKQCSKVVDEFLSGSKRIENAVQIETGRSQLRKRADDFVSRQPVVSLQKKIENCTLRWNSAIPEMLQELKQGVVIFAIINMKST